MNTIDPSGKGDGPGKMTEGKDADEMWQTRDGRRIPVKDMTEEHLRAALRLMIRVRRGAQARRRERFRALAEKVRAEYREAERRAQELSDDEKWGTR